MDKNDNVTYDDFQTCLELSKINIQLERQLKDSKSTEEKLDIQQQIDVNNQAIESMSPTTHEGLRSYKAYIANATDELKVNIFALNHPRQAEQVGVYLPEGVCEEDLSLQAQALKIMEGQVTATSEKIENNGNFSSIKVDFSAEIVSEDICQ